MKKIFYTKLILVSSVLAVFTSCSGSDTKSTTEKADQTTSQNETPEENEPKEIKPNKPSDFVPKGYKLFEEVYGDFNNDGQKDCILIIKGTDPENFVEDEYRGKLDRNRRGIVALINKNGVYELAVKNEDCFSSESEDGGVYYPPELSLEIKKGILQITYSHGRYGYWSYKFRYRIDGFEMIGYDSSDNYGPLVQTETSINFLSKKKQIRENQNQDPDGEDDFIETWESVKIDKLIQLTEIDDFDELDMSKY